MDARTLRLDHFKFYELLNQEAGDVVSVRGQFDKRSRKVKLMYVFAFANPVSKSGEPMYDHAAHLIWYDILDKRPEPTRVVEIQNQFGRERIKTGQATALLVPAEKYERGSKFPERLDHFLLYDVLDSRGDTRGERKRITLEDQFGRVRAEVLHYFPRFFAVPVKKRANGKTFGINNEKAHLAFYFIAAPPLEKTITVGDQFVNKRNLRLASRSGILAVPTLKRRWRKA